MLYEFFPDSSNVDPVILGVSVLLFVSYSMDIVYGVGFYNSWGCISRGQQSNNERAACFE